MKKKKHKLLGAGLQIPFYLIFVLAPAVIMTNSLVRGQGTVGQFTGLIVDALIVPLLGVMGIAATITLFLIGLELYTGNKPS